MSSHFDTTQARETAARAIGRIHGSVPLLEACDEIDRLRAALTEAETQRDEARRDWQMYVHEVGDETARADGAEARADRLVGELAAAQEALRAGGVWLDAIDAYDAIAGDESAEMIVERLNKTDEALEALRDALRAARKSGVPS